jgi:hypothetical protein
MRCLICKDLERDFRRKISDYMKARSSAYCRVSTSFVAYENVEMERAKSALEMHHAVCVYGATEADGQHRPQTTKDAPGLATATAAVCL